MTIQDWGALGEVIGSIAVLISLIYLAVQVRLVRKQTRLDSELHLTDQMARHTEQMGRDSELARLVQLANTDPSQLSDDESRQAMWWQMSFLYLCEGLYHRHRHGQVSQDAWAPYERGLAGLFDTEFLPKWWATQKVLFTDSFQIYVENELPAVANKWKYGDTNSSTET